MDRLMKKQSPNHKQVSSTSDRKRNSLLRNGRKHEWIEIEEGSENGRMLKNKDNSKYLIDETSHVIKLKVVSLNSLSLSEGQKEKFRELSFPEISHMNFNPILIIHRSILELLNLSTTQSHSAFFKCDTSNNEWSSVKIISNLYLNKDFPSNQLIHSKLIRKDEKRFEKNCGIVKFDDSHSKCHSILFKYHQLNSRFINDQLTEDGKKSIEEFIREEISSINEYTNLFVCRNEILEFKLFGKLFLLRIDKINDRSFDKTNEMEMKLYVLDENTNLKIVYENQLSNKFLSIEEKINQLSISKEENQFNCLTQIHRIIDSDIFNDEHQIHMMNSSPISSIICCTGSDGMGKTWMVRNVFLPYIRQHRNFFDFVPYEMFLEKNNKKSGDDQLEKIITFLKNQLISIQRIEVEEDSKKFRICFIDNFDCLLTTKEKVKEFQKFIETLHDHNKEEENHKMLLLIIIGKDRYLEYSSFFSNCFLINVVIDVDELIWTNREELYKIIKSISSEMNNDEILKKISSEQFQKNILPFFNGYSINDIKLHLHKSMDCEDFLEELKINLKKNPPINAQRFTIETPDIRWDDIGGQSEIKLLIKQSIEWPFKYHETFKRMNVTIPKGILLYGPPGCSKTMIAKAVATESSLHFLSIKGAEIYNKYVGESEKAIADLFRIARAISPCVLFFDEIDAIAGKRDNESSSQVTSRVLAQLLVELDGIEPINKIFFLAATNRLDMIDEALLRPGRLDRLIHVPLPNDENRRAIFKLKFRKTPVSDDISFPELINRSKNMSGAECVAIVNEAALRSIERYEEMEEKIDISEMKVEMYDFHNAFDNFFYRHTLTHMKNIS